MAEEVAAGALEVKTAGEAAPRYGDPSPRLTPGKPAPSLGLRDAVGHRRRHEAKVPALARKASSGFSLQGSQPFALSPQEIGADELSKAKDILPARDQNLVEPGPLERSWLVIPRRRRRWATSCAKPRLAELYEMRFFSTEPSVLKRRPRKRAKASLR